MSELLACPQQAYLSQNSALLQAHCFCFCKAAIKALTNRGCFSQDVVMANAHPRGNLTAVCRCQVEYV